MTEHIRLDLAIEALDFLTGFHVTDAWVGIGTFLVLDLAEASAHTASLWVYLADWAVLVDEQEILASDGLPADRTGRLPVEIFVGRYFAGATRVADDELHLDFSEGLRLEVWENQEAYGVGAELLHSFRDGEPATTLTFASPPLH